MIKVPCSSITSTRIIIPLQTSHHFLHSPSFTTFCFPRLPAKLKKPPCLSNSLCFLWSYDVFFMLCKHTCTLTRAHTHTSRKYLCIFSSRETITVWNSGYYFSSRPPLYLPSTILPLSLTHTSCLGGGRERQGENEMGRKREGGGEGERGVGETETQSAGGRNSHVLSSSERSEGGGREEKEGEGM